MHGHMRVRVYVCVRVRDTKRNPVNSVWREVEADNTYARVCACVCVCVYVCVILMNIL